MIIKLELQVMFQNTNVGLIILNTSFPWAVVEWNEVTVFIKHLWKEIQSDLHPVYNIYKPIGLKLLTRLRLGLSHLNEHRFNHNSENCLNPLSTCILEPETTSRFFLHSITIILSD